jgi:hypothetical protein
MPSLRDDVFCTFRTRTSATAAKLGALDINLIQLSPLSGVAVPARQGIDSAIPCSLAGRYYKWGCRTGPLGAGNRFLGSVKGLQIRALYALAFFSSLLSKSVLVYPCLRLSLYSSSAFFHPHASASLLPCSFKSSLSLSFSLNKKFLLPPLSSSLSSCSSKDDTKD